jgi:hypothetical protein
MMSCCCCCLVWLALVFPAGRYDAGGGLARAQFIAGAGRPRLKVRCSSVGTGQWLIGSESQRSSGWRGVAAPTTRRRRNREGFPPAQVGGRFGRWGWAEQRGPVAHAAPATARAMGTGVGWDGAVAHSTQHPAPELHACGQTSRIRLARRSPLTAGFCRTTYGHG